MHEIKFRVWDKKEERFIERFMVSKNGKILGRDVEILNESIFCWEDAVLMQYIGLKDKNGKEIYEGDVVGKEEVYHFIQRNGWQPETGNWKIIGEKTKNFTGKEEEKYIAGYELSVVEWKDKSCGFEPFSDSEKNCGHCSGGKDPVEIEVIGNIYENPELLK